MLISISPNNDNVNFEPVEVTSLEEFIEYATKYNYSTGTFKNNRRSKANFLNAESIAIDVDNENDGDNYTIEQAVTIFKEYQHIIMPSKSHRKPKEIRGGQLKTADRFRVILFLKDQITSEKTFTSTWKELQKFYPAADVQCKDASRFYYPSPEIFSKNPIGKKWSVTEYVIPETKPLPDLAQSDGPKGQLSRTTMNFLLDGVPEAIGNEKRGNRRLFKASKDMQEQGFTLEDCRRKIQGMIDSTKNWHSPELNEHDLDTIENAYKETPLYSPREGEVVSTNAFKFQSISNMIKDAQDVDWMVEDLLVRGGFSVMAGPPKTGKSTLVRQLIKAVCEGGTFLGRGVEQGSVAYLTFEEQPSILKEQFDKIGITEDHNISIHVGGIVGQDTLADFEEAIEDMKPDLVIIDTLFEMSNLDDINGYKATYDFLRIIRNIARKNDTHILGVHHTNKLGQFMGSQAIYAAVDTMFTFVQQRDRRFLFSSGKHGDHFKDQELLFDAPTESYSLGKEREIKADKL